MISKVLWTLDNETSPKTFERLCIDLLYRSGYTDIMPLGGVHDRGRDAEIYIYKGENEGGKRVFFQFSLERDWKNKLNKELKKVKREGHPIDAFTFMTHQAVTGKSIDELKLNIANEYGWSFELFHREWFRLQLEEAHPDLAERHLGIPMPESRQRFSSPFWFTEPKAGDPKKAWEFFLQEDFERAAIELRSYLKLNPGVAVAWKALAWCQYSLFRYDEAMSSINKALEIKPESRELCSIRGCILAERGIERNDQESISEANSIFATLIPDPRGIIHYNYGNTLSALSRHKEAVKQYLIATERDPRDARIWKNLASAYHELGQHKKEMKCFDRALEIDPALPQALISKGISMLVDLDNSTEAIGLINTALEANPDCYVRFPQVWFVLAEAHRRIGNYGQSKEIIRRGLLHAPGQENLRELQYRVYSEWWRCDDGAIEAASRFFRERLDREALDYSARLELSAIYESKDQTKEAWEILEGAFEALGVSRAAYLCETGFSLAECKSAIKHLPIYLTFRRRYPVEEFWTSCRESCPPLSYGLGDRLFSAFAIVFCLALNELSALRARSTSKSKVQKITQDLSDRIVQCTSRVSKVLATSGWISKELDRQELSERLPMAVSFFNEVAISESMRQWGWITGILFIPDKVKEPGVKVLANLLLNSEAAVSTLIEINNVAHVIPDKDANEEQ
jgi:tetratricopeptide (TPR) repeat protein